MARKIKRKLSKEQKSLLIGMLIGDGTITNHPDYKISHSGEQEEYLKCGYKIGERVVYVRVKTNPTIKALRRSVYTPGKTITRKLLDWLTPRELAIWYMDDGCMNINLSKQRASIQHTCKIATCVDKKTVDVIVDYFSDVWNIKFRTFNEGKNTFSIATSSETDCFKFVSLIKNYVEQVPSLLYKIRNNFTKEEFRAYQKTDNFRSARHLIGD